MKLLPESPVEFLDPLSKPPESLFVAELPTPFFTVMLGGTDRGLVFARRQELLDDFRHDLWIRWGIESIMDEAPLKGAMERFRAYFEGDRRPLVMTLQPMMVTPFTLTVHRTMTRIPFGGTMSYGGLAEAAGNPLASRAVGNACGKNRALVVIPCHRVVASNGIGGFGAGLRFKRKLLRHEGIEYAEPAIPPGRHARRQRG